jgi:hypothetical protein
MFIYRIQIYHIYDNLNNKKLTWYRDGFLYSSDTLPNTGVLWLKNRYENFVAKTT